MRSACKLSENLLLSHVGGLYKETYAKCSQVGQDYASENVVEYQHILEIFDETEMSVMLQFADYRSRLQTHCDYRELGLTQKNVAEEIFRLIHGHIALIHNHIETLRTQRRLYALDKLEKIAPTLADQYCHSAGFLKLQDDRVVEEQHNLHVAQCKVLTDQCDAQNDGHESPDLLVAIKKLQIDFHKLDTKYYDQFVELENRYNATECVDDLALGHGNLYSCIRSIETKTLELLHLFEKVMAKMAAKPSQLDIAKMRPTEEASNAKEARVKDEDVDESGHMRVAAPS